MVKEDTFVQEIGGFMMLTSDADLYFVHCYIVSLVTHRRVEHSRISAAVFCVYISPPPNSGEFM